jgi:hypothetical protein
MRKFILFALGVIAFIFYVHAAGVLRVDSVTVDSVWNADTTDEWGLPYVQRNVKLSFKPIASDSVTCVVDMSFDSGKTWSFNRDFFDRIDTIGATRAAPNVKRTIIIRISSSDTPNVVFRVTAQSDTLKLRNLRMSAAFNGWSEKDSTYNYYHNQSELAYLIDGFYMPYTQNGMVEGYAITIVKVKQDTLSGREYVADCGTSARAMAVFSALKPDQNRVSLDFPDSIAVAKKNLGGVSAYAHFTHFYVGVILSGYTVVDSALSDANQLFHYYQQKIGQ